MKTLKESLFDPDLTTKDINVPMEGTIAYDYVGRPWKILDIVLMKNRRDVLNLCKLYDNSGCMMEIMNSRDYNEYKKNYKYAVAAHSEEYGGDAVWTWGEDGLSYLNNSK